LTYLLSVQSAVRLARAIGRSGDAGELQRRAAILAANISKTFWDPEKRCFRYNLAGSTYSVHSNLFALRAGIVTHSVRQWIRPIGRISRLVALLLLHPGGAV